MRFMARSYVKERQTFWGVYDIEFASWPGQRPDLGMVKQRMTDEKEAVEEASRCEKESASLKNITR